jgi:hypothetical protein
MRATIPPFPKRLHAVVLSKAQGQFYLTFVMYSFIMAGNSILRGTNNICEVTFKDTFVIRIRYHQI